MKNPTEFESATERYRVESILGEGGSGFVYAVTDSTGASLAIKTLAPRFVDSSKRRRFSNELNFLLKNQHKHILTVLDHGLASLEGQKVPFFVMPRYASTLRHLLEKGIAPALILPAFAQILDGVEAAHLRGVVHRDLKPENILCSPSGDLLVVADFGIAHFEEEELYTAVETRAAERLANFRYAAPEQRERGAIVGKAADVYALGLMLNEMFTGRVIQGAGFRKIRDVSESFSYLDELVENMVQQDATSRIGSIDRIKQEISRRANIALSEQALDAARNQVVPKLEPQIVSAVTIQGVDWENGQLRIQLNRAPESGWIQAFKNSRGSRTYTSNFHWSRVSFSGNMATVSVESHYAQRAIDFIKGWLDQATNEYRQVLTDEAERKQAERRKRVAAELRAAEERAKVNAKLKF